jgi:6-pyruvoyltetrahydropterin/6-carboxytetrahydropterin synthase
MSKVRITKEFRFEMAHALWNYDGLCKNVHGHSYILFITVIGKPITDIDSRKIGMLIDFGDLKKIIDEEIISKFDHSLLLNEKAVISEIFENSEMFERKHILPFQPTCENLVIYFARLLEYKFPPDVTLYKIKLYETAGSYAEWCCDDR